MFDTRTLNYLHEKYPDVILAYLVSRNYDVDETLKALSFIPDIYSPNFRIVDEEMVKKVHALGMEILPWTLDEIADLERMKSLKVDGVITNYPDRMIQVFR